MITCAKDCKYNDYGFCLKYEDKILKSTNVFHTGILLHPLHYLTIYYNEDAKNIDALIDVANKYLNGDEVVDSICNYFARNGQISFKQHKLLLHRIFSCFETRERVPGIVFCQVE